MATMFRQQLQTHRGTYWDEWMFKLSSLRLLPPHSGEYFHALIRFEGVDGSLAVTLRPWSMDVSVNILRPAVYFFPSLPASLT